MFWAKLILLNLTLFIMWGRIIQYLMKKWKTTNPYLNIEQTEIKGQVEGFNIDFKDLLSLNKEIQPLLNDIRNTNFFRIFKVNFDSECNFWTQNKICSFSTCTICQCEEQEVPLPWKQDSIKDTVHKDVSADLFNTLVSKYNYSSTEWLVESEIDNKNGIYVNLLKNPETWTGYQGQIIWEAIYRENCFMGGSLNDMCLEEKLFYKVVSGLHSNINLHLSKNYLKEDIEEEKEDSNKDSHNEGNNDNNKDLSDKHNDLDYFVNTTLASDRVLSHPDRVNNLFYLYSVILGSLKKSESTFRSFDFQTGDPKQDISIKFQINHLFDRFNSLEAMDSLQKEVSSNELLKKFLSYDRLDQIKMRFRNISSIIDCVGCQKCKLHGKLQIYGLATMLKILFEQKKDIPLKRNELIAYLNLCSKVSRAIDHMSDIVEGAVIERRNFRYRVYFGVFLFIFSLVIVNIYFLRGDYYKNRFFSKHRSRVNIYQNRGISSRAGNGNGSTRSSSTEDKTSKQEKLLNKHYFVSAGSEGISSDKKNN